MKPYDVCPACQQVRPLNAHLMGLCDNCEKQYAEDMKLLDLQTAATTALYECPGALPAIRRALTAAETEKAE